MNQTKAPSHKNCALYQTFGAILNASKCPDKTLLSCNLPASRFVKDEAEVSLQKLSSLYNIKM